MVDAPNYRSVHKIAIPRMGGLFPSFTVLFSLFCFYPKLDEIKLVIIGSIVIMICGFIDDIRGMKWFTKLLFQSVSAGLLIIYFYSNIVSLTFFEITFGYPFNILLIFFFIVGTLNAINMMDGLDGLLGGFSLIISIIILVLAFFTQNIFLLILISSIIGALLGFIKFNSYPAKIFLGDTGSLMLGYLLIIASLIISRRSDNQIDLTFPVMLLGVPIIDTLKVMLTRWYNKKSLFMPDNNHLHHILLGFNIRHKTTVFLVLLYSLAFVFISFIYVEVSKSTSYILFGAAIVFLGIIKPFMETFFKTGIVKYLNNVKKIPLYLILLYKKTVIFAIVFTSIILLAASFTGKSILLSNETTLTLLFVIIMFFLSLYRNIKWQAYEGIYIFICWCIFFLISRTGHTIISNIWINNTIMNFIQPIGFIILALMIVLFFISRDQLFEKKTSILSGLDLIIMAIISLTFILATFIGKKCPSFIGTSFLHAFLFYMGYKVIILMKPSMLKSLFYVSFIIPMISLLLILFSR